MSSKSCNGTTKKGEICQKVGRHTYEGKLYCSTHMPEKKEEKEEKFSHKPYPWQKEVLDICRTKCTDDRHVYWIVDEVGGAGKNTVQNWISQEQGTKVFMLNDFGKAGDLAENVRNAIKGGWDGSICLINLTRKYRNNTEVYDAIEKIKDRRITRIKYTGGTIEIPNIPHILVFANFMPDTKEISADRLIILEVKKNSKSKKI